MKPQIIKSSILSLQVCVPATMTDAEVEAFANERSPAAIGGGLRWRVLPDNGSYRSRVQCDADARCEHLLLSC